MVRPIETTILQWARNALFDSRREIFDSGISEPRVFESADVETELLNHRLEASNAKLYICFLEVDSIVAGTFIADEEIGN